MTITAARLRAVRTTLEISGSELRARARLWRDFMPPAAADGSPLAANMIVETVGGESVPPDLVVVAAWLAAGDEVWKPSTLRPRDPPREPRSLEVTARAGPRWPPGSRVDVVVRLEDANGVRRNLRAPDQVIRRTD